jgi:predicted TIM-barrel fold metal-dependent hydrolase
VIVDTHCHAGAFAPLFRGDHQPSDLVERQRQVGVTHAVLSILNRHDMSAGNDRTHEAVLHYPGHVYGEMYLNPHHLDAALREVDRCLELSGFRGVKLHPSEDAWFPYLHEYYPLYEKLEAARLPILFHSGTYPHSNPLGIAKAARDFPGIPFILGHFGLADSSWECFPAAELADNVLVDTTANPMVRVMREWLDAFGAERMLWGSDFPFYDVRYELEKLDRLELTAEERDKITAGNAARIFRLGAAPAAG